MSKAQRTDAIVIGGGPAGLTAAHSLTDQNLMPTVLERGHIVGGISRTESYRGYHFDMGGHRFFTKSREVKQFWHAILADEFLTRPRLSRIYYRGKYFSYPLKPFNALGGLGPIESVRIIASYLKWQLQPYQVEETFEQWVTNRFGKRLFEVFFKTYTEKVWGISCSELKAEWAAQRIKDLSLRTAVLNMFVKSNGRIKTLIEEFQYPRLGPGMMWQAVQRAVERRGGEVRLNTDAVQLKCRGHRIETVVAEQRGAAEAIDADYVISSMPLTELVKKITPSAPEEVLTAANSLRYRDFLTVCLIVEQEHLFEDNWIYVHSPDVKVGRIQNFKNWSPDMVPDRTTSSLGLEYFCNEGDEVWTMADEELIALGKQELARLGMVDPEHVVDGCVFRVPKSYPVYDGDYVEHVRVLREYVEQFDNLQTVGRNGLHRYNNQDHAMLTGMLAVRNLLFAENHDLWRVNAEDEYHEEQRRDDTPPAETVDTRVSATVRPRRNRKVSVAACQVTARQPAASQTAGNQTASRGSSR